MQRSNLDKISIDSYLDKIEATFLASKKRQRIATHKIKSAPNLIDLGSAGSMHLFQQNQSQKNLCNFSLEKITNYPTIISNDRGLEKSIIELIERKTGHDFKIENIIIFRGVYDSYAPIILSSNKRTLLVPEHIHQTHKACFVALGFKLVEVSMDKNGLLDIKKLTQAIINNSTKATFLYINHNRGKAPSKEYLRQIGKLLHRYDMIALYDADVLFTAHSPEIVPWLPLTVSSFQERAIILGNLTKEFGVPGLRIGYGIASNEIAEHMRRFQQTSLAIVSPLNRSLADQIIRTYDLDKSITELKGRMNLICKKFEELGWKFTVPQIGVNLFIPVPKSFSKNKKYLPDELFCFYVASKTKVLFRPSNTHGNKKGNEFRIVICQSKKLITEALLRLKEHGICASMPFPVRLVQEYEHALKK